MIGLPASEPTRFSLNVVLTHDHTTIIRKLPASLQGQVNGGGRLGGERRLLWAMNGIKLLLWLAIVALTVGIGLVVEALLKSRR
jgi:hypothetical protein